MESSVQNQLYLFAITSLGGVAMGLVYDFYRLFRYYSRPKKFKTHIQDLLFWIFLSISIVIFVNKVNEGEFRGFIFIGFTIGILIYSRLLSKKIIKFISYIIDFIIIKVKSIIHGILTPIRVINTKLNKNIKDIRKYLSIPKIYYKNTIKDLRTMMRKK